MFPVPQIENCLCSPLTFVSFFPWNKCPCSPVESWKRWCFLRVMHPKDAEGIEKQCWPWSDCSCLIWVCTVCQYLSVRKLRKITVFSIPKIFINSLRVLRNSKNGPFYSPLDLFHKMKTNQRTSGPVNTHLTPGPGIYFYAFIYVYSPRVGIFGTNVDVNKKP